MHEDSLIMRILDEILMPDECEGNLGDIFLHGGYTDQQIKTILQDELDSFFDSSECLYIRECNNCFLKKYYKHIKNLLI